MDRMPMWGEKRRRRDQERVGMEGQDAGKRRDGRDRGIGERRREGRRMARERDFWYRRTKKGRLEGWEEG